MGELIGFSASSVNSSMWSPGKGIIPSDDDTIGYNFKIKSSHFQSLKFNSK